jgi:hypothetical protein
MEKIAPGWVEATSSRFASVEDIDASFAANLGENLIAGLIAIGNPDTGWLAVDGDTPDAPAIPGARSS